MGPLSYEPKFKQDVKTRSKHSGEDVIYGMGGLNEDVICTYIHIHTYIHTHIYTHTYTHIRIIHVYTHTWRYTHTYTV